MIKINDIEIIERLITNLKELLRLQGVYLLVSPSGKGYVGSAENLYERFNWKYSNYENNKKSLRPIIRAIRKYKWKNFKVYLLYVFEQLVSNDEMLALETAYIAFFYTTNHNIGYNVCHFGLNRLDTKQSKESIQKMLKNRIYFTGPNN